jgi:GntR family transcriptional repressor for pyruvate dehydrogenase complex
MCYHPLTMPIERLVETKRPRFVIDQILSSIQDGSLVAGERLPSEAKLAELTGVGRTSVREALAALRLMGVIETHVGNGSYVRETADREVVSNGIAQAIEQSEEAHQLQEARAVFECGLVRLAVARWLPEKAKSFEDLLSRMSDCVDRECYEDYIRLHRDFHLLLAQSTDNAIVEGTERSFLEYMDHEGWQDMERQFYLPNRREILRESVDLHRGIIDAVSSGDVVEASERMHEHFQRYE